MGRYTRKMKASADVTQPLGVITRARSLALQRSLSGAGADDSSCYLQLRSRRLLKVSALNFRQKPGTGESGCSGNTATYDSHVGENKIEQSERSTRESTPVTPPCSIIRDADILVPGSPRKPKASPAVYVKSGNAVKSNTKFKEYMAAERLEMRRDFMEKYNFDIFEDEPLPGRYEWERIDN